MKVTPRYPVFVIFQDVGEGYMPIVSGTPEGECFLAYQTKELAELYIQQTKNVSARHGDKYKAQEMNEDQFKSLLRSNKEVTLVAWNNTLQPHTIVFLPVAEILRQAT